MESLKIFFTILIKLAAVLATTSDIIIVTDLNNGTLLTAPIETLDLVQIPLQDVQTPVAVDYDPVEERVYWTDVRRKTINRAFLNGAEQEVVVTLSSILSVPDGITVDIENRHIYWTDAGTDRIERANLDGSGRVTILQENLDQPRAIVVDSAGRHLYWTDWGEDPKIEKARVDGSERMTLVDTDLHLPNGLAVDFTDQRIYWGDAGLNRIETTNLDGEDRKALFSIADPDIHPFDLGVYGDYIFWSDWALTKLVKMDKNVGERAEPVGPAVFMRAGGLHIHQEHDGSCSTNECENDSRCRQLINGYQCVCLPGFAGQFCEIHIDECTSSPCHNGGTCVDQLNRFECRCDAGFEGVTCDENIEATGCIHPGNLENGYVIPDRSETNYSPGQKVDYLCMDGYMLKGPKEAYCQSDFTWSHESPTCTQEGDKGQVDTSVVYGSGAGGALVILILVIILIVVCCYKSRRPATANENPRLNAAVHYSTQVPTIPKDTGLYNTAYDSASQPYAAQPSQPTGISQTLRRPAPTPRPSRREPSMHLYQDVEELRGAGAGGGFPSEDPPAYLDIIGDTAAPSNNDGTPYAIMK